MIQPWDRSVLGAIERAIIKSDIGLTPNVDGTVVRLNIPALTEERRKDLVRSVHKRMEEARVEIRNLRRDAADQLKKQERDGEVGADEAHKLLDTLQKTTDRHIAEVDRVGAREGAGGPRGLVARAPLIRPTDAPPRAHEADAAGAPSRRAAGDAAAAERPARDEAPPRRDHHGRQPPLGARARRLRARGPRRRRRGDPRAPPPRGPARHSGPDPVRLQPRELGAHRRRGRRACSGCSRARSAARPTSSGRRASASGSWAGSTSCRGDTRASIESALAATAGGERLLLNIAFNYAGRTELVDAVRRIVRSGVAAEDVDEATVAAALYTAGLPDPDLVIRTGGEQRLSNFLIWQSAYAELITTETLWPDFGPADLDARPGRVRQPDPPLRPLSRCCEIAPGARRSSSRRCSSRCGSAAVDRCSSSRSRRRSPAVEAFRLLTRGGLRLVPAARHRPRRSSSRSATRSRSCRAAAACSSRRSAIVLVGMGALAPAGPARGARDLRRRRRSARCTWPPRLRRAARPIAARRSIRRAARLARQRARLDPRAAARRLDVRHGRVLRRAPVRAAPVHGPHLAVEDPRGRDRRAGRRRASSAPCWSRRSAGPGSPALALRDRSSRPRRRRATSPSRCSSGPPAPRSPARSSRATAACSTGSIRSCSPRPSRTSMSSASSTDPVRARPRGRRAARLDGLDRPAGARRPRRRPGVPRRRPRRRPERHAPRRAGDAPPPAIVALEDQAGAPRSRPRAEPGRGSPAATMPSSSWRRATTSTSWSSPPAASSACGRSSPRWRPARSSRPRTRRRSSPAGTW